MKRIDVKQGTLEWLNARAGIVTASEMDNLVTPLWKIKAGDAVDSYLYRKLAEKWRGEALPAFSGSGAMEQGSIKEEEAIPWYEFDHDVVVERVGLITTDDGRIGCSPDGLLPGGGMEVKCPEVHTHVRYLLGGELPKDYRAQVQGCMLVTGAQWWKFLSYSRGMPQLLLTIERNEEAQQALRQAIDAFNRRLDECYARLVEINGGPPRRRGLMPTEEPSLANATIL
jgi:hypothetical protein